MPYRVTCKNCRASVTTEDGGTDALACACCPLDHSHEDSANAGTICRPCDIEWLGMIRVGLG
jgi:hypothetical protein